jgi:hypothetical protein
MLPLVNSGAGMPQYRIYQLDSNMRIVSAFVAHLPSNLAAVLEARELATELGWAGVEVWDGARCIESANIRNPKFH